MDKERLLYSLQEFVNSTEKSIQTEVAQTYIEMIEEDEYNEQEITKFISNL